MEFEFIPFGVGGFASNSPPGEPKAVHIIDDMGEGLRFAVIALQKAGFDAYLHARMRDFIDSFSPKHTRAVFVDVMLGDEDATDVLDYLMQSGAKSEIYLFSGNPHLTNCMQRYAEERGVAVTGVLQKPFTGRRLVEILEPPRLDRNESIRGFDIREGFDQGWIYPVLQPKLDLEANRIRSVELLTRVAHPAYGIISAQDFVGRITPRQSHQLFLEHLSFVRRHFGTEHARGSDFPVAINVDTANLVMMCEELKRISSKAEDFYRNIIFEITEESVAKLDDDHLRALYKLHLRGAHFSIDDFGIGHSNFARISRLPIDEIKLDRSIVHGCAAQQKKQIIVRSIIAMAHDLEIRVVAEGIESWDDLAWLKDARCDEAQGYVIGRPMKLDKLREFMAGYNSRSDLSIPTPPPESRIG